MKDQIDPPREKPAASLGRLGAAGCALMGPIVAGAVIVAHPQSEISGSSTLVQVARLDDLPVGGPAQLFQVLTDAPHATDAVDSVFVRRISRRRVEAVMATDSAPAGRLPVEIRGDEVWVRFDHAAAPAALQAVG